MDNGSGEDIGVEPASLPPPVAPDNRPDIKWGIHNKGADAGPAGPKEGSIKWQQLSNLPDDVVSKPV